MRTINEVYKEYKIMPSLGEHQMRVAGVALQICASNEAKIDTEAITRACLLHDMGNIIKSDLRYFPKFVEPEGLPYWESIKKEYINKYGSDENEAVLKIVQELQIDEKVIDIIKNFGYRNAEAVYDSTDFNKKICTYADFRVGPYGVLSLEERIQDGVIRYAHKESKKSPAVRARQQQCMRDLEKQIFTQCKIVPESITDDSIKPFMESLQNFEI